jgi:hypothetical protein
MHSTAGPSALPSSRGRVRMRSSCHPPSCRGLRGPSGRASRGLLCPFFVAVPLIAIKAPDAGTAALHCATEIGALCSGRPCRTGGPERLQVDIGALKFLLNTNFGLYRQAAAAGEGAERCRGPTDTAKARSRGGRSSGVSRLHAHPCDLVSPAVTAAGRQPPTNSARARCCCAPRERGCVIGGPACVPALPGARPRRRSG